MVLKANPQPGDLVRTIGGYTRRVPLSGDPHDFSGTTVFLDPGVLCIVVESEDKQYLRIVKVVAGNGAMGWCSDLHLEAVR
jgi:hypothetical protein